MDPYAPINGISLERYADLGAEIDGITDPEAQAQKVAGLGVSRQDWEAAVAGWTARMQDMSLMGQFPEPMRMNQSLPLVTEPLLFIRQ